MYTVDNNPKAPREYTTNLYSKIPMKQLLLFTRGDEQNYGDLYPPLLKYIVTYYPHLCLVEDWIDEEEIASSGLTPSKDQKKVINSTGALSSLGFGKIVFIQSTMSLRVTETEWLFHFFLNRINYLPLLTFCIYLLSLCKKIRIYQTAIKL